MWVEIKAWLRQDSTVTGLGAFAALVIGVVTQALGHQMEWTAAAGLLTGGLVHLALPGNSKAQADAAKAAQDLLDAALKKKLAVAMPELFGDGMALVQDLQPMTVDMNKGNK